MLRISLLWLVFVGMLLAAVNINTASIKELTGLKGIGEAKAKAIVEYRESNGKFNSVDELSKVKGIGQKTVEKLKSEITVD
jgi:competence protein ComEA